MIGKTYNRKGSKEKWIIIDRTLGGDWVMVSWKHRHKSYLTENQRNVKPQDLDDLYTKVRNEPEW